MEIDKKLLERYSSGRCSGEERQAVEKWLETVDKSGEGFKSTRGIEQSKANTLRKLGNLVPQLDSYLDSSGANTKVTSLHNRMMRYAAAVIILFTVGFFSYRTYFSNPQTEVEQVLALKTIETQRGEKRTITLSDGSTIRMNYESEVKVPEKFEGKERVVYLKGQAHFDVARNEKMPFIIYTEDSKTEVLGTSFDINTKTEGQTEIIVTSGKVAFSSKGKEDNGVTLVVNDRALLTAENRISTSQVDAKKLTAWTNNQLIFEYQSLREIIEVVEPWYDVSITVEDQSLLDKVYRITADDPSLRELLDQMSFIEKFEYSMKGNKVIIHK